MKRPRPFRMSLPTIPEETMDDLNPSWFMYQPFQVTNAPLCHDAAYECMFARHVKMIEDAVRRSKQERDTRSYQGVHSS
jgi:hypothetical protein